MHNIQLGSEVVASDGRGVGKVDQVVIDPETRTLLELVVQHSIFHTGDRIVPMDQVERVDEQGHVHLKITADETAHLPAFVRENYLSAPHGGTGPSMYPIPGYIPAYSTGIKLNVEMKSALTPDLLVVDRGTDVLDSESKKLGEFDEIVYGDDGIVTGLIVRTGHLRHHEVRVPIDKVAGVGTHYVRLSLTHDDFQTLLAESTERE